jgi:hypothetical protein
MLVLRNTNPKVEYVPVNKPTYKIGRSDKLAPLPPRKFNQMNIDCWYELYRYYIDCIVNQFLVQSSDITIDELDVKLNVELARKELVSWLYKVSSTKMKNFYFLK